MCLPVMYLFLVLRSTMTRAPRDRATRTQLRRARAVSGHLTSPSPLAPPSSQGWAGGGAEPTDLQSSQEWTGG